MNDVQAKPMSKAQEKRDRIERAVNYLREILPWGSTVYTSMKHVSRSGMYRRITVMASIRGEIVNIGPSVALAVGMKLHDDGSVGIGGCGSDMGFEIVYALGWAIHKDPWNCVDTEGRKCPHNSHSNRDASPVHEGNGYSLFHRWI